MRTRFRPPPIVKKVRRAVGRTADVFDVPEYRTSQGRMGPQLSNSVLTLEAWMWVVWLGWAACSYCHSAQFVPLQDVFRHGVHAGTTGFKLIHGAKYCVRCRLTISRYAIVA